MDGFEGVREGSVMMSYVKSQICMAARWTFGNSVVADGHLRANLVRSRPIHILNFILTRRSRIESLKAMRKSAKPPT